jgi:hypothetical protein
MSELSFKSNTKAQIKFDQIRNTDSKQIINKPHPVADRHGIREKRERSREEELLLKRRKLGK